MTNFGASTFFFLVGIILHIFYASGTKIDYACKWCEESRLSSKKSEPNEVKIELMRISCSLIINKQSQIFCYGLFEYSFMNDYLDNENICYLIKACHNEPEESELLPNKSLIQVGSSNGIDICPVCITTLNEFKHMLNQTQSRKFIRSMILRFCNTTGSFRNQCVTIVNQNFNAVVDLVLNSIHPKEICYLLKLCRKVNLDYSSQSLSNSYNDDSTKDLNMKGQKACTWCQDVAILIKQKLKNKATVAVIKQLLNKLCGSNFACKFVVNKYLNIVVKYITQKMKPRELCMKFHLCPRNDSDLRFKPAVFHDLLPMTDDSNVFENEYLQGSGQCVWCQKITEFMKKMAKDKSKRKIIKFLVKNFCGPNPICRKIADKFVDQILKYIDQKMDTKEICQKNRIVQKNA